MLLYLPVCQHGFINYDDNYYVTQNFHVWSGLTWKNVMWAFTTFDVANWHPLAWISHELDVQLFGLNAAGHHLSSVMLHALNAVLLFLALLLGTGRRGASFTVAALFAVHPLAVESVAWVAERKNVLCTTFWLLTLLAYGWYAKRPGWRPYLAVTTAFALALMSKPMAVTLPFVLLLLDFWPLKRWSRARILEKAPLFVLSAASSWMTLKAQTFEGAVNPASFPLRLRLENALLSYGRYLEKIFWPAKLAIVYPHPRWEIQAWQVALAGVLLALITALALREWKRRPYIAVGWFYFLGTLVPVIGLVQVGSQAMADRYAYIPMMGVLVIAVWATAEFVSTSRPMQRMAIAAASCIVLILITLTLRQESYWKDDVALFSHTLEVTSGNNVAHDLLGLALAQQGRLAEAAPHFYAALEINPRDEMAHANFGYYRLAEGDAAGAAQQFKLAISNTGNRRMAAQMYADLGALAWKQRDIEAAKNFYFESLRRIPEQYRANLNVGLLFYEQGNLVEARCYIERSLAIFPTSAGYVALGRTLHAQGSDGEAAAAYRHALVLTPDFSLAQQELKGLMAPQGIH
jgi:Tfp pilus assembly protein PilF